MSETIKFIKECPKKNICIHSNICLSGNYDNSIRTPYQPLYITNEGYLCSKFKMGDYKVKNSCEICGNYVDEDYFPCNVCNGIVNYFSVEKTVPMLCFQHGGSEACEEQNKKFGFICPKCSNENLKNEK
jgi:hypothetical protein